MRQSRRSKSGPLYSYSLWMDTMNRCNTFFTNAEPQAKFRLRDRLVLIAATLVGTAAFAQSDTVRPFPPDALRGTLVVTQPPLISIDGESTQLSPGARILDTHNRVVPAGHLVNQSLTVNYTREQLGLVHQVWVLRPEEAALKRKRAGE